MIYRSTVWLEGRSGLFPEDTEVTDQSLHGVVPTQVYLANRGGRMDPLLRRYLESVQTSPFTYFDVVASDPGHGVELRDIMTGEQHQVTERSASKGMQRGDILFGQLAKVGRLTMLEASNGFAISPREKASIVELRSSIASEHSPITDTVLRDYDFEMLDLFHDIAERAFNPQLPELQNTDGEPLSLRKLIFDLDVPPQAAFDALKHLAFDETEDALLSDASRDSDGNLMRVSITWKKPGNKVHADWQNTVLGTIAIDGARLIADVNSAARADAVAKEIETALGEHAQFRVTQVQSMEKMLADARASGGVQGSENEKERNRLAERPEVREKLAEMMAAHFERWVDQPIPALDGRTPMDAVKDADGRDIVESLVIEAERLGRKMNPPTDAAVFQRLRERLGLAMPR